MVQSLVVISRDHADVNPVRFPNMRRAYDFNRDDKGGEPSREPGAHCDIQMGNYNHITKESSLRKNCSVMRTVPLAARRYLKTQCSYRLTKNYKFLFMPESETLRNRYVSLFSKAMITIYTYPVRKARESGSSHTRDIQDENKNNSLRM